MIRPGVGNQRQIYVAIAQIHGLSWYSSPEKFDHRPGATKKNNRDPVPATARGNCHESGSNTGADRHPAIHPWPPPTPSCPKTEIHSGVGPNAIRRDVQHHLEPRDGHESCRHTCSPFDTQRCLHVHLAACRFPAATDNSGIHGLAGSRSPAHLRSDERQICGAVRQSDSPVRSAHRHPRHRYPNHRSHTGLSPTHVSEENLSIIPNYFLKILRNARIFLRYIALHRTTAGRPNSGRGDSLSSDNAGRLL